MTPNELVFTFVGLHVCVQFGENRRRNATVRVSTDGHTHTHGQKQNDFIICPMLYAIAMGQIIRKNRWRPGLRPDPTGGARDAPPDSQVVLPLTRTCGTHTLQFRLSAFGARPRLQCPNYGHLTYVQTYFKKISFFFEVFLHYPWYGGKVLHHMSVCLSVHISKAACQISKNFLYMLPATVALSSSGFLANPFHHRPFPYLSD